MQRRERLSSEVFWTVLFKKNLSCIGLRHRAVPLSRTRDWMLHWWCRSSLVKTHHPTRSGRQWRSNFGCSAWWRRPLFFGKLTLTSLALGHRRRVCLLVPLLFLTNTVCLTCWCFEFCFLRNFAPGSAGHHFEVVRKWAATNAVMLVDGGDSLNLSFWDDDGANGVLVFWWIVVWGRQPPPFSHCHGRFCLLAMRLFSCFFAN